MIKQTLRSRTPALLCDTSLTWQTRRGVLHPAAMVPASDEPRGDPLFPATPSAPEHDSLCRDAVTAARGPAPFTLPPTTPRRGLAVPVLPALFAMGRRSEATASGRLKQRGGWPRCPEAFPDILSLLVYRNSVEHLACYAFDDRDESTQWLLQNHRMLGVGRDLCGSIKAAAGVTFLLTLGKRVKTHTLWETAASAEDDHVGW